jgi:serine/threonine-protein kinase RsbW
LTQRPIVLEIPASSAYLTLVRAATTAVCARIGYQVDRLDDTSLAASEAVALLLKDVAPGEPITISWIPVADQGLVGVDIELLARGRSGRPPRPTSFTWTVLASLVNHVDADMEDGRVRLRLQSRQETAT